MMEQGEVDTKTPEMTPKEYSYGLDMACLEMPTGDNRMSDYSIKVASLKVLQTVGFYNMMGQG